MAQELIKSSSGKSYQNGLWVKAIKQPGLMSNQKIIQEHAPIQHSSRKGLQPQLQLK